MIKNFTLSRLSMLWILLFFCSPLLAQNNVIRGKVADESGAGLPGVNIIIKGTSSGTTSDAEGAYSLSVPSNSADGTLVYSFIGFTTQEQPINGRTTIDVSMEPDVQALSEVIVTGYGTQEKRDVTSSISSIKGEAIARIPTSNAMDALKGQIAGVDVLQNGGRPGQAPTITIRGRRSLTASNDPLFVVDGIPMTAGTATIADFNPADFASVEVLKDAASQAIYGSRGSNGVILVTTKRATPGTTKVNFSTSYGVTTPFKLIPMMNGEEFAQMKREANRLNAAGASGRTAWGDVGSTIPSDAAVFNDAVELNSVTNGLSTDWQDLIYQNGAQSNTQFSIAGGSEKSQVLVAFSNFKEDGLIEGVDYGRYTGRINADQFIGNKIKIGVSSLYSNSTTNNGSNSVIPEAVNQTPLGLPYDANGNIIFLPISDGIRSNPLSELVPGKRINEFKTTRIFSSFFAEVEILEGLKYKFLIGLDHYNYQIGNFEGQYTNTRKNGTPSAFLTKAEEYGYTMENLITYNKSFGEHSFGLTFLQSAAEQEGNFTRTDVANLPYETMTWNNLGLGTVTGYQSNYGKYTLLSYMGRVNYSYKGKYLLQASMRWDGSSRLAEGNKWSSFPGISAGWRIKDEGFMSGINAVTELKLRASYGKVGNTSVNPYQTQGTLAPSLYDWNNADARGFRLDQIPNPDLSWEISESFDAGIDFGFFNGRLSGYLDYYHTSTGTSLILNRGLPPTSGYDRIVQNIGGTETTGYEVTLNGTIMDTPGGLKWTAEFNFGSLKEKIVDLAQRGPNGELVDDIGNGWFIGEPIRVFFDYEKTGIWQADEKDAAFALMDAYPGEIKLKDQDTDNDGDGIIDGPSGRITPADRKVIGNDVPKAYGGLSTKLEFKGFDLGIFFYYRLGFMINSQFSNDQATMQARYNNIKVDYWTIDNPTNEYPRPNKNQENITNGTTLRYMDGGYIKLRNVTLGYTLPLSISERLKMTKLRFYVQAQNPIVWSNYKLFDPERAGNVTSGEMPSNQMWLGGINITF
ncbi:MAG TPA: TonB-dependent receptor [Chryseolinea sp.]|nr:TonB-dependent receptor [Chryseolinea sp.]